MDRTRLTPERWQRMQELFGRALSLAPYERERLLALECGEDTSLRDQVIALLRTTGDPTGDELDHGIDDILGGTVPPPEMAAGTRVGRYRIRRLLGRGGMSTVYLAERDDEHYHQFVALKVMARGLFPGNVSDRFRAERQILARLNHPNIARLLDGGQAEDGTPYLVMEHIEGMRIDEYYAQHQLSVRGLLPILQQVCAAVQYAHQNLIVHRDLKPSNILVTTEGVPKLLDFGIAKLLLPGGDERLADVTTPLTCVRDRLLTPEHASPEQFRGEPIGTASDIYSLGALFYGLLSGLHPYEIRGRSMREVEKLVCESSPLPPSERLLTATSAISPQARLLARELAGDIDNIVLMAMHRDVQRRYPSAAALAHDIQNYLDGLPVQAQADSWAYRSRKFVGRHAVAVTSAVAMILLIGTLVTFYTIKVAAERDVAERERQTAASVSEFMMDVFRRANPNETDGETITVRGALDAAARRIDTTLADQPRLRLALMRNMSEAYNGLGLWPEARALVEKTLAQEREEFGDRSIEVARSLEMLGSIHYTIGQLQVAARRFDEAWSIRVQLGKDRDAEAASLLSASASNLRSQLRFAAAVERHQQAEALARSLNPPSPRVLGRVLQDFSVTESERGDQVRAERYARESLPLLQGALNEGNDLYGNSLAALANALRKQFKLEESEKLHRAFVARQTRRLGHNHLLVGRAQNNFGALLRAKGDYVGSSRAFEEALRIYSLLPENDDVDVAVAYHNLGGLHHESGDLSRALREINLAIEWKQRGGLRSPLLVSSLIERAGILREMDQLVASEASLHEAESIAQEKLDAADRRHTLIRLERGRFLFAAGRTREAEQELQGAVESLRIQEDPQRLADALSSFSEVLAANAKFPDARRFAAEALNIRKLVLPASHPAIAAIQTQIERLQATVTAITRQK